MQTEDVANSADRIWVLDFQDGKFSKLGVAVRGAHLKTTVHGIYKRLG